MVDARFAALAPEEQWVTAAYTLAAAGVRRTVWWMLVAAQTVAIFVLGYVVDEVCVASGLAYGDPMITLIRLPVFAAFIFGEVAAMIRVTSRFADRRVVETFGLRPFEVSVEMERRREHRSWVHRLTPGPERRREWLRLSVPTAFTDPGALPSGEHDVLDFREAH
ncbi:hypothetical protein [Actinomadura atramentaria]|uniref:hypothetical protein n=1 Tax=Actinomadura atramentaria TaxID=1990 RepID=UPI0003A54BEA|nr:hypothetical protein [Actinomadura atramentaria]